MTVPDLLKGAVFVSLLQPLFASSYGFQMYFLTGTLTPDFCFSFKEEAGTGHIHPKVCYSREGP